MLIPARNVRPFDVIGGLLVTGTTVRRNERTGVDEPVLRLESGAELTFTDPAECVEVTVGQEQRPASRRIQRPPVTQSLGTPGIRARRSGRACT